MEPDFLLGRFVVGPEATKPLLHFARPGSEIRAKEKPSPPPFGFVKDRIISPTGWTSAHACLVASKGNSKWLLPTPRLGSLCCAVLCCAVFFFRADHGLRGSPSPSSFSLQIKLRRKDK